MGQPCLLLQQLYYIAFTYDLSMDLEVNKNFKWLLKFHYFFNQTWSNLPHPLPNITLFTKLTVVSFNNCQDKFQHVYGKNILFRVQFRISDSLQPGSLHIDFRCFQIGEAVVTNIPSYVLFYNIHFFIITWIYS